MLNKLCKPLIVTILLSPLFREADAQFRNGSITKVGGFVYFNKHDDPVGRTYSLNLEREKTLLHNGAITHGPRMDYQGYTRTSEQTRLGVGYDLKVYPLHGRNARPYHGVFAGVILFYYLKIDNRSMYGPGGGALLGYQHLFKNSLSLALEGGPVYFQNVNKNVNPYLRTNELDRYFDFFANIKIGIRKSGKHNK